MKRLLLIFYFSYNVFFKIKFASQMSYGSVVNNRIERTTWRKEREENGRGQNGGVIEKAEGERGRERTDDCTE